MRAYRLGRRPAPSLGWIDAHWRSREERRLARDEAPVHTVACTTHIGLTHEVNQDTGGAWSWRCPGDVPLSLAIVADGVSSGPRSQEASRHAVETVHAQVHDLVKAATPSLTEVLQVVVKAALQASSAIAASGDGPLHGASATTFASAVCLGAQGGGAWCGDSRVYHLRRDGTHRLTRDHSWTEEVVGRGLMTAEQAARDPRARMITRWLGPQDEHLSLDTFEVALNDGDTLLCCSDGLYGYFSPPYGEDHELMVGDGLDLAPALDRLVALALARGGHDDVTAAAIRFKAEQI